MLCNVQGNNFVWQQPVLCTCYIRYILNKCMHRSIRLAIQYIHIGNQIFKYIDGQNKLENVILKYLLKINNREVNNTFCHELMDVSLYLKSSTELMLYVCKISDFK